MEEKKSNFPNITLGQYKGLAVTRRVRPVSDQTVEQEMQHLTRTHASYHPTTAPAKTGSRVMIDFVGYMDGVEIPDSRMEKVLVILGSGKLLPAAEQAVYGHCAGETFRFDFTYPDHFRVEELSGKTAQFEITLHSVTEKQTPALNEDFAKACGYASLDEMRVAVRAKKQKIHEDGADRAASAKLLEMAGANLTVKISPETIQKAADNEMKMLIARLIRSNMTIEEHCRRNNTTASQLEADFRAQAETKIRTMLAARAIAEKENITVSPYEVEAEYARLSRQKDTPEDEIRKVLSPDAVAAVLAAQKVQRFLLENAVVTTEYTGSEKE